MFNKKMGEIGNKICVNTSPNQGARIASPSRGMMNNVMPVKKKKKGMFMKALS